MTKDCKNWTIALILALMGCQQSRSPEILPEEIQPTEPQGESFDAEPSAAIDRLLRQGANNLESGHTQLASRQFERAKRLDPKRADVYYHLSSLRLKEGRYQEAIQLAIRGTRLADKDKDLAFRLYVILSVVYERLGDDQKAKESRSKAYSL